MKQRLKRLTALLREGCAGQLPGAYDRLAPGPSKSCFAQARSAGEPLRVYEALEKIESEAEYHAG